MLQLMVFDMAGTTVDENNVVYRSIHQTLVNSGYEFSYEETLLYAAGKGKLEAFRDILHRMGSANPDKCATNLHQAFKKSLNATYQNMEVKSFSGVRQTFKQLKAQGIQVVLNTGYDRHIAHHLLQKLNWIIGEDIDGLITNDDVSNGRPHPDMIQLAMKSLSLTDSRRVGKIGDSVIDIEEGQAAGCGLVVGITSGAQSREQLQVAQPDAIIDHMEELLPLIVG